MQDVCWVHNHKYRIGDQCPDCVTRDESIRRSIDTEVEEKKVDYVPGTKTWNVVKMLVWFNVVLWALIIMGAVLLSNNAR